MPRDIRSYFTTSTSTKNVTSNPPVKRKKRPIISSDEDDVKVLSPVKRSKVTKRSKHHVLSDSDDDITIVKETSIPSTNLQVKEEKPKKIVSPADILGTQPIRRENAPKVSKKLQKLEAKFHDDDEFEATLKQLDTSEECLSTVIKPKSEGKNKNEHISVTPVKKQKVDDGLSSNEKAKTEEHKQNLHLKEEKSHIRKETTNAKSPHKKSKDDTENSRNGNDKEKTSKNKTFVSSPNKDVDTTKSNKVSPKKPNFKKLPQGGKQHSKLDIQREKPKKSSPEKHSADEYEERIQKKKEHAALYQQYLQRGGARNPGSKQIPTGAEYCLAGLSFLITGVLESLEREEAEELIKKYGGRILHQVSRKTDYVIVGDEPGPAKIAKADSFNVKKITEDDLLELIRTRPAGNSKNIKQTHARVKETKKEEPVELEHIASTSPMKEKVEIKEELSSPVRTTEKASTSPRKEKLTTKEKSKSVVKDTAKMEEKVAEPYEIKEKNETEALVEKYRPKTMKQILGQQTDKSNARKLYNWLNNWHKNQSGNVKHAKPSPWAKNDDGAFFKAALLSGPPGIGKTTTAQVVCKELGFDLLEFNASDTRSKKLLKEEVSDLLSNTTMKGYFTDKTKPSVKHALLMDEVDGMAGNEDRGGLQELIALIKSTEIPIICICNDRNNPKMRTLANYTYDLKFQKPRVEQIRGAMKSICYKEKIDISTEDLDRLIESTNQDIRQVINHLALFVGESCSQEKTEKKHINKDLKLGPWDVVRKVFSAEEHKSMSIHDKSDLFFHDYSIAPLFVQENYLSVVPHAPKSELLERVALSADSLAYGDMVDKAIRNNGAWSLLPVQACYSSVIPGTLMSGHISAQINFPAWLGRNSKRNKFDRLLQEITVHTRLVTGASKNAINLDYLKPLRDAIVRPLVTDNTEGIDAAIDVMNHYHLMREDLDSLTELSLWPGQRDPMQAVDSKVKAAFTRAYNKNSVTVPYTVSAGTKKKASQQDEDFVEEEGDDRVSSDEDEDNVETDRMIKAKKPTATKKTEPTAKTGAKGSKRGRGRGKTK